VEALEGEMKGVSLRIREAGDRAFRRSSEPLAAFLPLLCIFSLALMLIYTGEHASRFSTSITREAGVKKRFAGAERSPKSAKRPKNSTNPGKVREVPEGHTAK